MEEPREFVESLARGLAVIRAFDAERTELTLAEVATATGLARATARRFLLTLEQLGYVRSDGRLFALTPRVLELGFAYLSGLTLPEVAQPHLERLSQRLGESTSASVLDGAEIVYVARVPTRRIMNVGITIGTRFAAAATSMGRVLLTGLDPARLDELLDGLPLTAFTSRTVTDAAALRTELDIIRAQGFALVDQELEDGLRSVAAPVRVGDVVIAAVNISSSTSSATLDRVRAEYLPALLETATRISDELTLLGRRRGSATVEP